MFETETERGREKCEIFRRLFEGSMRFKGVLILRNVEKVTPFSLVDGELLDSSLYLLPISAEALRRLVLAFCLQRCSEVCFPASLEKLGTDHLFMGEAIETRITVRSRLSKTRLKR